MATISSPPRTRDTRVWPTVLLELVVVAGLFAAYRSARLLAGHSRATAVDNAHALLTWERALRLPGELDVQHLMLTSETITRLANVYYATVHFPLTVAFLVWLFIRNRDHYYRIRTSLALLTGLALSIHAAFPLAPARMLSGRGFVDTAAMYGPAVYSSPATDHLTNQFAAMPSLHFGWAVLVAHGIIRASRSRYRLLWIAHPVVTLLVIVGTANHYWADAAIAGGLLLLTEYAVAAWWRAGRWLEDSNAPYPVGWSLGEQGVGLLASLAKFRSGIEYELADGRVRARGPPLSTVLRADC
ncbi:MAG TPA: phosphatase PAP2 family protein [Nocardioidaceae bacterium]|nr:phosphatase PAP2 family protein [Nocardioidaceae bacterium]